MGRIVERGGRAFLVEGDRVVAVASSAEELVPQITQDSYEAAVSDRVEYQGRLGEVVTAYTSVYGKVAGIRFDNGDLEEVLASELKPTDLPHPKKVAAAASSIHEKFSAYEELSVTTEDELQERLEEARSLNLEARALLTGSLPLGEKILLDRIVASTQVDIYEIGEQVEALRVAEVEEKPYEVKVQTSGTSFTREDASWLSALDVEPEPTDTELAKQAVELVDALPESLLEDDEALNQAIAFSGKETEKFRTYVAESRMARVAKVKETPLVKTASQEEDIPFEAIFK